MLDAGAVTALRTGAAAVLAAETLGRADADAAAVIGAGVNGRAAARTFLARGRDVALWDVDAERARAAADELGARRRGARRRRSPPTCVVTVTPGHEVAARRGLAAAGPAREPDGRRRPGQGGDRGRRARARRGSSATTGSRRATAASSRTRSRPARSRASDVTELGAVLAGERRAARSDDEITVFDSTGLAIQDLAIALAAIERVERAADAQSVDL